MLKKYAQFIPDFPKLVNELILNEHPHLTDALKEILSWETTPKILSFLSDEINKVQTTFVTEAELNAWTEFVKKDSPLKASLFFRACVDALQVMIMDLI